MSDFIEERLPPHSIEAETAVLGSILIDPDMLFDLSDVLAPAMFYRAANGWIYEAMTALQARREPVDLLTVSDELRKAGRLETIGDIEYLVTLANAVPTSLNAEYYAGIVAEKAARRQLLATAGSIAKAAYDEAAPVDEALSLAERGIIAARAGGKSTVMTARQMAAAGVDDLLNEDRRPPRTISTGLIDLDALLGGLNPSHQYVIAGRTSMGKSSMAIAIALDALMNQRKRVMMFSLEMSDQQVRARLVSVMTGITTAKLLRSDTLSPTEKQQALEAYGQFDSFQFYFDGTPGLKPADVRARATRQHMETGLDMVIVDHLHIMQPDAQVRGRSRAREIGDAVVSLADTYKTLDVAGLTLAQLNRGVEARAVKRPTLSDLRDSGEIEENAYAVLMLHRDAYYDPTKDAHLANVSVAKNRDGATGGVDLYWHGELATFKNLKRVPLNPPRSNGRVSTPPIDARQGEIIL